MANIPWTTGTVTSAGEEIYYETTGDGADTVVLCHGLGGNHAVWFQQVPVLAETLRVVTWDQRGFGRSTNRANVSGPPAAVDDLTAVLDQLRIDRAHLVGRSMGGWCVLGFALRWPERIGSLVIADSTAGLMTDAIQTALAASTRLERPASTLGSHPAIGERLRSDEPAKAFLYQQIGGFRGNVDDGEMIGTLLGTRYETADVAALRCPVLCVVGADDDLIPPAAVRSLADTIPEAQMVEIAGAGHSPYFERPDAWNAAVLEFLRDLT